MKKRVFRERYNNAEELKVEDIKEVTIKDKKTTNNKKATKKTTSKKEKK